MNPYRRLELKAKGWEEHELRKAEQILEKAEAHDLLFSKMLFWTALIVVIISNFIVSLILIPFLTIFNGFILYFTLILLALCIGFVYNFLILDIKHLQRKHHMLASILIPMVALINLVIVVLLSNSLVKKSTLATAEHNPWLVGIIFAIAFILPYFLDKLHRIQKLKRAMR